MNRVEGRPWWPAFFMEGRTLGDRDGGIGRSDEKEPAWSWFFSTVGKKQTA